ncbi:MAG TPA: hypothetical protein PK874_09980 [Desulfobacteraceae bacterium]|jgi:hypothetical protein|nr:hypothetical protein [Desulfobacteraceae bacterium]HPJ67026.1 hypothetical protein [Desulfobacteraceae bacterium]HPQ27292.1 hypothetical protein [Desulfobacteraceae bacterium]
MPEKTGYRVFISYSHQDSGLIDREIEGLLKEQCIEQDLSRQ